MFEVYNEGRDDMWRSSICIMKSFSDKCESFLNTNKNCSNGGKDDKVNRKYVKVKKSIDSL